MARRILLLDLSGETPYSGPTGTDPALKSPMISLALVSRLLGVYTCR
jgi:hypothetical protein